MKRVGFCLAIITITGLLIITIISLLLSYPVILIAIGVLMLLVGLWILSDNAVDE